MPKVKLLDDENVVALLDKKLGQATAAAAKDATRMYKNIVRSVKESLSTANLDRKLAKTLTDHIIGHVAQHEPGKSQQDQAAD